MEWLQGHWESVALGAAIALEIFFRLVKSDKVRSGFRMIAWFAHKIAELLDKVVPDRTPVA